VCDLQSQLATAQAQILNLHCQQANLLAFLTDNNPSFGKGGETADYDYDEPLGSSWTDSPASQVTDGEKDMNVLFQFQEMEMFNWSRNGK
jgi:hypothetical protein